MFKKLVNSVGNENKWKIIKLCTPSRPKMWVGKLFWNLKSVKVYFKCEIWYGYLSKRYVWMDAVITLYDNIKNILE